MNLQVLSSKPQFLAHGLNELVANLDIYFPALMKLKCKLMFHHHFQFLEIMKLNLSSIANTDKYTSTWKKKITFIFREALMSYQTQILPIKSQIYKLACSI